MVIAACVCPGRRLVHSHGTRPKSGPNADPNPITQNHVTIAALTQDTAREHVGNGVREAMPWSHGPLEHPDAPAAGAVRVGGRAAAESREAGQRVGAG